MVLPAEGGAGGSPAGRTGPCAPPPAWRRRCLWGRASETAHHAARSAARPRTRPWRFVQHGVTGHGAEGQQQRSGQPVEQRLELSGGVGGVGPAEAQARPQPGEGGANQPRAHGVAPAPQRARRHHVIARAGVERPLAGRLDPLAVDPHDGLQHRTHGAAPAPQLGGKQRGARTVAEGDPQDRHLLEDLAGGEVGDALAVPDGVAAGAAAIATPTAATPRRFDQGPHVQTRRPDRWEVGSKAHCEYTLDCVTWGTGGSPTYSRGPRPPLRVDVRATKCRTQRNPQRTFSSSQCDAHPTPHSSRQ